ncbi:transposase [Metabacillus sp. GX 13764]|uniref:transposase n=1 Tax=Metabacillus kandeliae TaxID=2900151 RepID=UPI001E310A74|nr:transposase [Metabacillus kandeliae]MCD7036742.1 transposase [Metabacillus kandeliae]
MLFSYSSQEVAQNREFYLKGYDAKHGLVSLDSLMNWHHLFQNLKKYYPKSNGRPSADPIILVKILMIQSLEGFRSVRSTCKQVSQNMTYRWFLGISPFTCIPHHSTISKFLWKRLGGPHFWRKLFGEQLKMIHREGFLSHETWVADETELKANANKRIRQSEYIERVIEENEEDLKQINHFRKRNGKKPLKPKGSKMILKRKNWSPVDPDAALSVKHEKRGRFAYFEHRIVDSLHNFIIGTEVTAANVPGHKILLSQLDSLQDLFGRYCGEIALDSGYYQARLAKGLFERSIFAYISYRRTHSKEHPQCRRTQFQRVKENLYSCPCGVPFYYQTTTRQGYHEFKPPKGSCDGCPFAKKQGEDRILRISIHQETYDNLHKQRLSTRGKILRSVRPATVELSFAHSKELHGLRYARYRGVQKVKTQVLMTAIIQNLKKWAKLRSLQKIGLHLTYKIIEDSV